MINDTQDKEPSVPISLDEVGLTDFKTQVSITRGTKLYSYNTDVSVFVNLPSSKKGVHLSRFVESISEIKSFLRRSPLSIQTVSI